jgi:hypothetical protein
VLGGIYVRVRIASKIVPDTPGQKEVLNDSTQIKLAYIILY